MDCTVAKVAKLQKRFKITLCDEMSSKKDLEKAVGDDGGAADSDLDELLNSALEDFVKKPAEPAAEAAAATTDSDSKWTEEYLKKAAVNFESSLSELLSRLPEGAGTGVDKEHVQQSAQQVAEVASQVLRDMQPAEQQQGADFAATITKTLQGLSLGSEGLQGAVSDQDLMDVLGSLGQADGGDLLPMFQGMMQSLLSKEVLYPHLKDMVDAYPEWLRTHKDGLDAAQYERYVQQHQLMGEVCTALDAEADSDPEDVRRERFGRVLGLMQRMQDLGQPPAELAGAPDGLGDAALPGSLDPNQCALM